MASFKQRVHLIEMEPRLRARPEQFAALVKFMESQGDLSKPQKGGLGRSRSDRLWQKLTNILNSYEGGVEKSVDKWKKVWADWKTKTKKKYFLQKRRACVLGGGPRIRLTALEQRVIAILGVNAAGNHGGTPQDFNQQPISDDDDDPLAQDEVNGPHLIEEAPHMDVDPSQSTMSPEHSIEAKHSRLPSPPRTCTPVEDTESQAQTTSRYTTMTPPKVQLRSRRSLEPNVLNISAQDFAALEQRRLQLEETREKHEHEREIERLRLETRRIEVAREHNKLLLQLSGIINKLIDTANPHGLITFPLTENLPK